MKRKKEKERKKAKRQRGAGNRRKKILFIPGMENKKIVAEADKL
jgi:hypothetical protein